MGQREFAEAVRANLKHKGQTVGWLAERIGELLDRKMPYSTLLTWLDRSVEPSTAFLIEQALEAGPGTLTHHLGYLPVDATPIMTAREAIESDPRLSPRARAALLAAYREFVKG